MQEGVGARAARLWTVIAEVVGEPLVVDRRHSSVGQESSWTRGAGAARDGRVQEQP
jgi:hypothetical protein